MKAAAVALACVLRFAAPAQADEAARPQPPPHEQTARPEPPPELRPWVDPSSAQQVGKMKPPAQMSKEQAATPPAHDTQRQHQCLNPVETRQTVAANRLAEPFRALRVGRQQGEALRAKLCRWKQDQFVYEVFVLRRDGHVVRLYMNAQNGQSVGALDDERH